MSYCVNKYNQTFTISKSTIRIERDKTPPKVYLTYEVIEKNGAVNKVFRLMCDCAEVWKRIATYRLTEVDRLSALSSEEIDRKLMTFPYERSCYYRVMLRTLIKAAPIVKAAIAAVDPNAALMEQAKALEAEKRSLRTQLNELATKIAELSEKKNQQNHEIGRLNNELQKSQLAIQRALQ